MSITRAVFSLKHRRGARYQSAANAFPAIDRDRSDGDRSNNDNGRTSAVIADYVIVIRAFFQSFRPKCVLYARLSAHYRRRLYEEAICLLLYKNNI